MEQTKNKKILKSIQQQLQNLYYFIQPKRLFYKYFNIPKELLMMGLFTPPGAFFVFKFIFKLNIDNHPSEINKNEIF